MGITDLQKAAAEKAQWKAAADDGNPIRLVAGPGTGKSSTIERRVAYLLNSDVNPKRVFTISFTRATTAELSGRIIAFCATESLPEGMTLEELLDFLGANDEVKQRSILDAIASRSTQTEPDKPPPKRVRILTMHGAKGLSGKIVFIPSLEQGVLPSFKAINATGLLNEQRRLLYVSLTRAKAACILSHAVRHSGAQARPLQQQAHVALTRSQFLNEMGFASVSRSGGLTAAERTAVTHDVANLD